MIKLNPNIERMAAYTPIEPFEVLSRRLSLPVESIIKLDANENPFGMSPKAKQALAEMRFSHIYPDPESRDLRKALSEFTGIPEKNLLAGAGADELIDLLLRVLLEPGDRVINCPPTFGMYGFDTQLNSGDVVEIRRKDDFSLNLKAIQEAVKSLNPKLLFITSPNNPDGSMVSPRELEKLLELPVLVVVDEAYIEFCDDGGRLGELKSWISQVPKRNNLVVLRTFSKWAGLAGLRVGYGAFPDWLMRALWKAKQPYNVNVAANAAAIASLQDIDYLVNIVSLIRAEKQKLFAELKQLNILQPYPTQANFILCRVTGKSAVEIKEQLASLGILVRYYDTSLLQDCVRISVSKPQDNQVLIEALEAIQTGKDLKTVLVNQRKSLPKDQADPSNSSRISKVVRVTKETQIEVNLNLDGNGKYKISTGLVFLDHMLAQIAVHGLLDIEISANGDLEVDPHHTVEDVALTLGQCLREALGDRSGIVRMASAFCPMDESLAQVVIDFSGRPYTVVDVDWHAPSIGNIPVSLFSHFFESVAFEARCNLHAKVFYGRDDHHQAEALFKALGRAIDAATRYDPRRIHCIPSSKGVLF